MIRKILLLLPLIIFISCGGDVEISPGETYVKFFGDEASSFELKDMVLQGDGQGGVVLFGVRDGVVDDQQNSILKRFHLVFADANGNSINDNQFTLEYDSDSLFVDQEASRITAIDGGGYLLIGTMDTPSTAVTAEPGDLVKLIVWVELDNNMEPGPWMFVGDSVNNYYGVDINVTDDGGVLIAGYTDVNGDNDFFYSKDGGSSAEWSRVQTRVNSDDQLIRALPTSDGNFVIVGRTDAPSDNGGETGINVERTIIDQNGTAVNSSIYGTSSSVTSNYDDIPYDVIEKPGGFAIVGEAIAPVSGTSSPFLLIVDLTGAASSEVNYAAEFSGFTNFQEGKAFSLTQTLSNDFIIVGEILDFIDRDKNGDPLKSRNGEVMIMPTDQGGTRTGSISNFGVENGDDRAVRVLTAPDGSILVGATYDFGGGLTQFALLKMNVQGELRP